MTGIEVTIWDKLTQLVPESKLDVSKAVQLTYVGRYDGCEDDVFLVSLPDFKTWAKDHLYATSATGDLRRCRSVDPYVDIVAYLIDGGAILMGPDSEEYGWVIRIISPSTRTTAVLGTDGEIGYPTPVTEVRV